MSGLEKRGDPVTADLALRDGTIARVKVVETEGRGDLEKFVGGLSEDTIFYRFLTVGISREALVSELSPRTGCLSLAAVVEGEIVGLASYCRTAPEAAEVGLLVADGYQGKGVGTGLTERIARAANREGVSVFEAIIDWNNTRMIKLVRNLGFPTSERVEPELIRVRFPTSIDPVTIAEFQEKWVFGVG